MVLKFITTHILNFFSNKNTKHFWLAFGSLWRVYWFRIFISLTFTSGTLLSEEISGMRFLQVQFLLSFTDSFSHTDPFIRRYISGFYGFIAIIFDDILFTFFKFFISQHRIQCQYQDFS